MSGQENARTRARGAPQRRQGEEVLPPVDLYIHQREKMSQPGEGTVRVGVGIHVFEDPVLPSVDTATEDPAGSRSAPPRLEK
jgi:hypothetical protein